MLYAAYLISAFCAGACIYRNSLFGSLIFVSMTVFIWFIS
jgi:hypothetical protein